MFCGLGEKVRTRVKKKKRKKQNKRTKELIAAKTGLVEMKKYLKTYYRVKYFFAVLKPFLNATAFYAKLSARFSGPETEKTWLIASKFGTSIQLINLKLLSKFHVARSNVPFLSYKQMSGTLHSLVWKWPGKNKGTRDASVGRSYYQLKSNLSLYSL